jgi:cytochrome c-type biogenesis protein CcmF
MRPSRNYYPARTATATPFGRFFEGEATSEVDLRWGLSRDFWTAVQPDTRSLRRPIAEADRRFATLPNDLQVLALAGIVNSYAKASPTVTIRALSSPLIMWIWLGGAVILAGSLVALWPTPATRERRARSLAAARLGRDLSRA